MDEQQHPKDDSLIFRRKSAMLKQCAKKHGIKLKEIKSSKQVLPAPSWKTVKRFSLDK